MVSPTILAVHRKLRWDGAGGGAGAGLPPALEARLGVAPLPELRPRQRAREAGRAQTLQAWTAQAV